VADCAGGPDGRCAGGIACWPDHETGCCLDCGTIYTIRFPEADEIQEAASALAARPAENRNWRPDRGETAKTLRGENITHGYAPEAR
jgi:hypothetical protein